MQVHVYVLIDDGAMVWVMVVNGCVWTCPTSREHRAPVLPLAKRCAGNPEGSVTVQTNLHLYRDQWQQGGKGVQVSGARAIVVGRRSKSSCNSGVNMRVRVDFRG